MYEERTYRRHMKPEHLVNFTVVEEESDLHISADRLLDSRALEVLLACRKDLKERIARQPEFLTSLEPVKPFPGQTPLTAAMTKAARQAGVGPMAAVAGAVAETVGRRLLKHSREILVENGGDLFLKTDRPMKVLVHAGPSPFTNRLALKLPPFPDGMGLCTSSGTFGHSLSFGKADAVVVLSPETALADAAATALCNQMKSPRDMEAVLDRGRSIPGITGILIIMEDRLGTWGDLALSRP